MELTGRMVVVGPRARIPASGLAGRQGRLVLASLGAAERAVPREALADRLWEQSPPRSWRRDLSAVISKLRAALGGAGLADLTIDFDGEAYELLGHDVDIRQARRAAARLGSAPPDAALASARAVLDVTGDTFLPGEDAAWIDAVRAELARLRADALELAATVHTARGDPATAIRLLEELLAQDAFRESGYRTLMAAHLAAGNRAEAVRVYERLRIALGDALGLDPSPETEAVYVDALRAAAPSPGAGTTPRTGVADAAFPPIRYARSGPVNIAYQVVGDGPVDLVWVPGWVSNLEVAWEEPRFAAFLRRLGAMCRLVLFDKRGTGLSDPVPLDQPPDLDTRMEELQAVMDHCGSEAAVILGFSEGGTMSIRFAVSHPDRVAGLILWGSWSRATRTADHPFGWTAEQGRRRFVTPMQQGGTVAPRWFAAGAADDPEFVAWFHRYARQSASPGMALSLLRANASMDVRDILGEVDTPTLVLHRSGDLLVEVDQGRYLAEHIPGARLIELAGDDHWPWTGDPEPVLAAIAEFLARVEA